MHANKQNPIDLSKQVILERQLDLKISKLEIHCVMKTPNILESMKFPAPVVVLLLSLKLRLT
jgi:hypothetical protein